MSRPVLVGLLLSALAAALVLASGALGPEVQPVALLGAALGGALGLVPDRAPAHRAAGFAIGLLAAWLGYLLRAAALPDTPGGRAVAVLVVVAVCALVAAGTRGAVPLWAALLGAAAMAGSYEAAYAADPTAFVATSPASATAVLLTAGAGFVVTSLVGARASSGGTVEAARPPAARPADGSRVETADVASQRGTEPAGAVRRLRLTEES